MSFGERLRELREEKKLRQKDLGNIIGVSGRQIGNYEADKQLPRTQDSFSKLFKLFDVSADYLFELTDEKNYSDIFKLINLYNKMPKQIQNSLIDYANYLVSKRNLNK